MYDNPQFQQLFEKYYFIENEKFSLTNVIQLKCSASDFIRWIKDNVDEFDMYFRWIELIL